MTRRQPEVWAVRALTPRTNAVRLASNSPADPDHLLLEVWHRTGGHGQAIRLPRISLVRLGLWLRLGPAAVVSAAQVFLEVRPTGMGHVEVLEVCRVREGVWLKVTHRADDYPQSAWCVVGGAEARLLGERIVLWDEGQPGGPAAAFRGPRPVVDVDLPS